MKVLIADDEKLECQALEKMLHRLFPSVTVLDSVMDGTALVEKVRESRPDIAIVDINMPGLNGLEAIEVLRGQNYDMEIIIHTAYSEFDYIHKAMRLGADDYLVKPVFEEDFRKAFSRVLDIAGHKKQILHMGSLDGSKANEMVERNILMSVALGMPDDHVWDLYAQKNGYAVCAGRMAVLRSDQKWTEPMIQYASRYLERRFACLLLPGEKDLMALFLVSREGDADRIRDRKMFFNQMLSAVHAMEEHFLCPVWAGVSSFTETLSGMPEAFQEALIAAENRKDQKVSFGDRNRILLPENPFSGRAAELSGAVADPSGDLSAVSDDLRKSFSEAVSDSGRSAAGGHAEYSVPLRSSGQPAYIYYYYAAELLFAAASLLELDQRRTGSAWNFSAIVRRLTARYLRGNGGGPSGASGEAEGGGKADGVCRQTADQDPASSGEKTAASGDDLFFCISDECQAMRYDYVNPKRKENAYVSAAILYMEQAYQSDLSLENVADHVGITQFYLSRLFKQEKNQNFSDMMTDIRISKALHMMLDSTRSVQNISAGVGYTVKYFYQAFRNTIGISQKEYREMIFQV